MATLCPALIDCYGQHRRTLVQTTTQTLRKEWEAARRTVLAAVGTALAFEELVWARGMHLSRCFPARLASGTL